MKLGYLPILIYFLLAVAISVLILFVNRLLGPRRPTPGKAEAYESGIHPQGDARGRFHIRYYVIAMLFLLFDLEIAFIYPWAVIYRRLGLGGLLEMLTFLVILLVGYLYAWKRGALKWE